MGRPSKNLAEIATGKKEVKDELTFPCLDKCISANLEKAIYKVENADFENKRCNEAQWIEANIIPKIEFIKETKHHIPITAETLEKCLSLLKLVTAKINESVRYCPTVMTFCNMMCISSETFYKYTYENNERGESARIAQDFFKGILLQGIQSGEYNPVAGSFIGKTTLGMRENDGNQTNINIINTEQTFDQIMEDYKKNQKRY